MDSPPGNRWKLLVTRHAPFPRLQLVETPPGTFLYDIETDPGTTTNTRRNKAYDNLVFDGRATVESTGRSGVLDLMAELGLNEDQALEVSDRFPVWAEFSALEAAVGPVAAGPPAEVVR